MIYQPINYSVDVKPVLDQALEGYNQGLQMRQVEAQKQQQLQLQSDLTKLSSNPNASAQDYASMMVKYPQLAEHFKKSWDVLGAEQQKTTLSQATQIYAALQSGNNDAALKLLDTRIEAATNSGNKKELDIANAMKGLIEMNPQAAKTSSALMLSSVIGPEKFADTFKTLGDAQRADDLHAPAVIKATADAKSAEADATIKTAKAKYADSEALLDLEKKGWDVKKIQEDIKIAKENNRIAAMNAAIAKEGNQIKRDELTLKVQEAKQKRDEAIQAKVADVDSARMNIDNMLNTADRILKNPSLNNVLGSIEGRMPSVMSDEGSDAIALIDTLGSQAFLAQIPNIKGMGALSNEEGKKLQSALQNLSREQSEGQFKANVKEAQRLMLIARKNISKRYGVPDNTPDTPAAVPDAKEVNDILNKYLPKAK